MKKVCLVVFLFVNFFSFSQRTVQFSDPIPGFASTVSMIDASFFGKYKSSTGEVTYIIDEKGISIESMVIASVTREQIRESSKLRVSGDYLYGIKANDSVPCVLDGENYYYGIVSRLPVCGIGSLNSLKRLSANQYVINFHEGSYFEPSLLTLEKGKLTITHGKLDYQDAFHTILQTNTITRYGSEVVILAPTDEQWERLMKFIFTDKKIEYTKVN